VRLDTKTLGLVATTVLGYVIGNYVAYDYCLKKSFEPEVYELPFSVSIVVTAAYEPDALLEVSLSSLRSQSLIKCDKNNIEIILVAGKGVNVDIAKRYCDKIIMEDSARGELPPGKLTARHIGICEAKGDIIVATDADTYYPPGWLAQLLKPYLRTATVVATHGPCIGLTEYTHGDVRPILGWWSFCTYYGVNISGRNSSFVKSAYFATGGFDLNAQKTFDKLLWEEEFAFKKRLQKVGKVKFVPTAVALTFDYEKFKKTRGLRRTTRYRDELHGIAISFKYWLKSLISP